MSQVANGLGIPILVSSSSSKAYEALNELIREIIADWKSQTDGIKKNEGDTMPSSYISFLLDKIPDTKHSLLASHIAHTIIALFPDVTALIAWSLVNPEMTVKKSMNNALKDHAPILTHLIIDAPHTVGNDTFSVGSILSISPALQANISSPLRLDDILCIPASELVVGLIECAVDAMKDAAIEGKALEMRYAHLGMAWAYGVRFSSHAKEE